MQLLRWSFLALALSAIGSYAHAQSPTVDVVLERTRANIKTFRETLPNLASDETVISDALHDGKSKDETTITSTFRVTHGDKAADLKETRVKLTLNGKPVKDQKSAGPFAFGGGIVSAAILPATSCHTYKLVPAQSPAEQGKLVLVDHGFHVEKDGKTCGSKTFERRFVIDPVSFQVLHTEFNEEDVTLGLLARLVLPIGPDNILTSSSDLAPTKLGEQTFYLTTHVSATLISKRKPTSLRYNATYTNYHRFAATMTIGPATEVPADPEP